MGKNWSQCLMVANAPVVEELVGCVMHALGDDVG
jgi:hypothetical protein